VASPKLVAITDDNHERIEAAFRKYFYRADPPTTHSASTPLESPTTTTTTTTTSNNLPSSSIPSSNEERHEFEIIICHANVIRYFVCRALQLPPETWLRMCPFNCSLTYLTIRPTGTVSLRMMGDIGHLPSHAITFSGHYGFQW
jgi:serine/threonine-protein phosphatase PGAM5